MLNRTVERDLVLSIGDALQALDEADAAHTAKAPVGSMPPDELFFAGAEAGLAEPSAAGGDYEGGGAGEGLRGVCAFCRTF